ncbi:MAG TPA: hypothetical protein VEG38_13785 [Acidimicrobiia bacterium]|nr:hypothetical protein [Acidimicrobiia bacterium]
MSHSWDEVKALLDDPFVDADTKEHLLAAYIQDNGLGYGPYLDEDELPDEVRDYYDQYPMRSGDFNQGSLDDVYADAQAESEEGGYSHRLVQDELDRNTSTLDGLRAPTSAAAGVEKSDELFDLARSALRVFEDFIPVNDEVPSDTLGRHGRIAMDEIRTRYDEQMGISFRKFLEDAERLRAAHESLSGLRSSTESELNTVYKSWSGPAANASYQYYSQEIAPNSSDLVDFLSESPGVITTLVENVFAECKAKADTVLGLYSPTVGSATPEMAQKVVSLANGDIGDDDHDRILEVAAWVDSQCGTDLENRIRSDDCDLNGENKEYVQRECKAWVRDSFNVDLHDNLYETFKQTCDDTLEAVNGFYEGLNEYLADYENKFGEAPPPQQFGPQQPGPGPTGPGPTGPGPLGPGSPGGPSGPGGPGGPSMPPVSTPPPGLTDPSSTDMSSAGVPTVPSSVGGPSGSTSPQFSGPGAVPPGSFDPGMSGLPGGQLPGSSLPGAGMPGAGKEVTIRDGNRTITVGQPDARGRSPVTVDDGKGEPSEYVVDWTAEPGEVPEEGVIQAENGKAVIQDGDAAITLEQVPGPTDRLKMTVDDGTPETYDMDFGPDSDLPGPAGPLPDVPSPSSFGSDSLAGGGGGGGGGSFGGGGGGGGSFGGADTPGTSGASPGGGTPGAMAGAQAPDAGPEQRPAAASVAGGGGSGGGGQTGTMGGMPMGGMGAGGGQGGDQTRQSKWRTTGQLFDDQDPAANFSGVVGRDPGEKAPKK